VMGSIFFNLEDWGSMFVSNVDVQPQHYSVEIQKTTFCSTPILQALKIITSWFPEFRHSTTISVPYFYILFIAVFCKCQQITFLNPVYDTLIYDIAV
jgi:hypothetical protein